MPEKLLEEAENAAEKRKAQLEKDAKEVCGKVFVIGDAEKCGRIANATAAAYKASIAL